MAIVMNDQNDGHTNRKSVFSFVLVGLMFLFSGGMAYRYFADVDSIVPADLMANAADQEVRVACERCGANYSMAASDYLTQVAAVEAVGRIVCETCGAPGAWRDEAPIEFSNDQWRAGYTGQDVLVSDLKAYHAKHPESDQ